MGASHSEARSVISNRKLVRGEIFALVAEHFPDFKPHDRLPGYRYCFSRKLKQSPTSIPVFLHLVVQHHRRKGEVLGY